VAKNGEHDLKPYPEYRDSGLPWLGLVPKHWDIARTKRHFRLRIDKSGVGHGLELLSIYTAIGVRPRKDLEEKGNKATTTNDYWLVSKGDIIVNKLLAWMGAVGVSHFDGVTSPAYDILKSVTHDVDTDYYHYLFRTGTYLQQFKARSRGIMDMRLRLYFDQFGQIPLLVPPKVEQRSIIKFLDALSRKVNRFIRNRRQLIEVLNEQKQAIIDRAITRGLDPTVKFKPSGIDWLGDVPEHWEVRRLKNLVQNLNEQTSSKNYLEVYIALEHVESWTGRISLPEGEVAFDSQVKRFKANDILFGKLRPYLAKVTRPQQMGVCVGEFLVLRPSDSAILPAFLEQKLRSKQIIDLVNSSTFGAKMPRADWGFVGNVSIAFPTNEEEQTAVLNRISAETAALTNAIKHAQCEIALVQEYRTRLIADVVTGKVDVRQLSADLGPEAEAWGDGDELIEGTDTEDLDTEEATDGED